MPTKYEQIITQIFHERYGKDESGFEFPREAIAEAANVLGLTRVSNVGDVIYTFRSRKELPASIRDTATQGREWIIRSVGAGRYRFDLIANSRFVPSTQLTETRIPDSTPALIQLYKQSDEQALLAILRYNRLIDVFTRLSCFSVQNHLRTAVKGLGQVEIDELYVGIDRRGAHYAVPIEVKSATDTLGFVQIENMFELCADRFPRLITRPLGAQFIGDNLIAMFEFERSATRPDISISTEKHYRLAPSEEFSDGLLERYALRADDEH